MGEKILRSIRGAVRADNTVESITENVGDLCRTLFKENGLTADDIVNVQFTVTPDLDALNPATALRKSSDLGLDPSGVTLFCSQEPVVKGMMARVIRIMVTAYIERGASARTVYINGTEALRPDLASK